MAADRHDDTPFRYDGFASPTFTSVPDDVFDVLLPRLSDAELRALLYIIRRTFGFKRQRDPISFGQFLRGITMRDGRRLDHGCGLRNKTALSRALRSLEAMGVIVSDKGLEAVGDRATTVYRLRFQGEETGQARDGRQPEAGVVRQEDHFEHEVVREAYHGGTPDAPPVVRQAYPQDTGLQETGRQGESKIRKPPMYGQVSEDATPPPKMRRGGVVALADAVEAQRQRLRARAPTRLANTIDAGVSDASADAAASGAKAPTRGGRASASPANDPPARPRRHRAGHDEDRRVILAYIEDFARELGDQAALTSSTSRACNLYRRSGIDQETFVEALLEARAVTKARGAGIRALATKGNWLAPTPKMAYFFAVLEDMLGLREA